MRNQLLDRVLCVAGFSPVNETRGKPFKDPALQINLAQQQPAGIRSDHSAVEGSYDLPTSNALKLKLFFRTLLVHTGPLLLHYFVYGEQIMPERPSCDQKRTLLYAEYLAEDLLLGLPQRQFVFTIPKMLRPSFKADKRLFGEVSRLIFSLLSEFFSLAAGRELLCACVVSYQSFGEFARFHLHWHVLVLEGGFTSYDRFVDLPLSTGEGMLKSWKHSGFSIESGTRLFSKADREAAGQYVVRSATSAEKIHYDPATDTVVWTAAPKGFHKGKAQTFKGHEFVDQLGAHLPPGT